MKLNRFIPFAVIALFSVGGLAFASASAITKDSRQTAPAAVQSQDCSQDQADSAEVGSNAPDTDTVDLQCGDQSGADTKETVSSADTDTVDEQVGDQSGPDAGVEATETAAPAGM